MSLPPLTALGIALVATQHSLTLGSDAEDLHDIVRILRDRCQDVMNLLDTLDPLTVIHMNSLLPPSLVDSLFERPVLSDEDRAGIAKMFPFYNDLDDDEGDPEALSDDYVIPDDLSSM